MKKLIIGILFFASLAYAGSIDDSIKAANQGDASAQFSLGSTYEYGLGVRVDYKEAAKWYRKAAEQGDTWAQVSLGDMYVNGKGVRKDLNKAKELFQKACNHGEKSGCEKYKALNAKNAADYYSLGEKYDDAAKVHNMVYDDYSDLKLAKKAFAKACQYNYKDSCKRKEAIEKSMQYLGDANVKKLKNRIKKLKEEGLDDLTIAIKLAKEDYLYWAQMRYGKYGYEIQKEHLQSIKKSGMPEIYSRCMACHGKKGDKKALGRSKKINKLSKEDFIKAIRGYQNATYGGSLKSIMISQVKGLSPEDIESISKYLKLRIAKKKKIGIFYDKDTGLTWQDNKDAKTIKRDWNGAKEYCENLDLGGYSDWGLPTKDELESKIDELQSSIDETIRFKNTAANIYWSSSPSISGGSVAWSVDSRYDSTYNSNKLDKYYVRCVRGR